MRSFAGAVVSATQNAGQVPRVAAMLTPTDSDGYYDVIITASTSDGFTRRYAGRIS